MGEKKPDKAKDPRTTDDPHGKQRGGYGAEERDEAWGDEDDKRERSKEDQ